MTGRPTGLTVTLPLVWRGGELRVGPFPAGVVMLDPDHPGIWDGELNRDIFGFCAAVKRSRSRAVAERAVERAAMEKLGGVG